MKTLLGFAMLTHALCSIAQGLQVRVVDDSGRPQNNIPVMLRSHFMENRTARKSDLLHAQTDKAGVASFPSALMLPGGFSVIVGGTCHVQRTSPIATSPGMESGLDPSVNPVIRSLPATISVVVYRRSFSECLRWILSGGS